MSSLTQVLLLIVAFTATAVGTFWYRKLALRHKIVAKVNFRSLHGTAVPRGGGLVFASVFTATLFLCWLFGILPTWLMFSLALGGCAASLLGFMDDIIEIHAVKKFIAQFCLAVWLIATLYLPLGVFHLNSLDFMLKILFIAVLLCIPIWFINLCNFIDGIDGLAVSGTLFVCMAGIIVMVLTDGASHFLFIFELLAVCCLGFLFFNRPPASVFMGDSGSIFIGYCLSALFLATVLSQQMSVWTWATILGYFIGDTATTFLYRIIFVKKWYAPHRSHAYQNLARVLNNHAKVTYGIIYYNIFWILPLVIWSTLVPDKGPIATTLSIGPAVLWSVRFGPRLSNS